MARKRKVHTAEFKAQVALAALKGDRTINELAGEYGVHPTLIHGWKKQFVSGTEEVFGRSAKAASADAEARQAELFEQIGRLKMELEWMNRVGGGLAAPVLPHHRTYSSYPAVSFRLVTSRTVGRNSSDPESRQISSNRRSVKARAWSDAAGVCASSDRAGRMPSSPPWPSREVSSWASKSKVIW